MRAGVDHRMCFFLGPGKVRNMCVIEVANEFLENVWGNEG